MGEARLLIVEAINVIYNFVYFIEIILTKKKTLTDEDDQEICEVEYNIDEQIRVQQQVVMVWPPLPYCYKSCLSVLCLN